MNIIAIGGGDRKPAIKKSLDLAGEPSRVLIVPSTRPDAYVHLISRATADSLVHREAEPSDLTIG